MLFLYNIYMKKDENELFRFIKSISVGLKQYTVRELTVALKQVLKGTNSSELEFVNQAVCSHYSISHKTFKTEKTHGNRTDARHVVFCILFFQFGLSQISISRSYNVSRGTVQIALRRFRDTNVSIKADREFKEAYESVSKKVEQYIKDSKNDKDKEDRATTEKEA